MLPNKEGGGLYTMNFSHMNGRQKQPPVQSVIVINLISYKDGNDHTFK